MTFVPLNGYPFPLSHHYVLLLEVKVIGKFIVSVQITNKLILYFNVRRIAKNMCNGFVLKLKFTDKLLERTDSFSSTHHNHANKFHVCSITSKFVDYAH